MGNFREVNDDILKDRLEFREETYLWYMTAEDKKHNFKFDEFLRNILNNIPNQKKKYVEKQLDLIYDSLINYDIYITEKYYRNGFVDGSQLVMGCFEE